jgi:hypothetical protein
VAGNRRCKQIEVLLDPSLLLWQQLLVAHLASNVGECLVICAVCEKVPRDSVDRPAARGSSVVVSVNLNVSSKPQTDLAMLSVPLLDWRDGHRASVQPSS